MDLHRALALMTDSDAELCLNGILKGWAETTPQYAELLVSQADMKEIIEKAGSQFGAKVGNVDEVTPDKRPKAIRAILVAIADNPTSSARLEAWISHERPTRLEPITTAIVLGGIIFLLSLDIDFKYENTDGHKTVKLSVKKPATPAEVLKKFLDLFNVTGLFK